MFNGANFLKIVINSLMRLLTR